MCSLAPKRDVESWKKKKYLSVFEEQRGFNEQLVDAKSTFLGGLNKLVDATAKPLAQLPHWLHPESAVLFFH